MCVCVFFFLKGGNWERGRQSPEMLWFSLSGSFSWTQTMEICTAGEGLWLFLSAFVDQVSVFVLRVLACERVLGGPSAACWLGPCTLSLGPGVPSSPLSVLPPPHPRAAPQLWASPPPPYRRESSAPFPEAGSSRALPVSFLSLDSQGGFSSCVSSHWVASIMSLCNPMDCSPPGSSVHGTLQARTLEWVAVPFSRGSSWPGDGTRMSQVSCIGRQVVYH